MVMLLGEGVPNLPLSAADIGEYLLVGELGGGVDSLRVGVGAGRVPIGVVGEALYAEVAAGELLDIEYEVGVAGVDSLPLDVGRGVVDIVRKLLRNISTPKLGLR